jgi:hypothetical protein
VSVEALIPKERPFESEKVMAERRFEVVPALTLMFVRLVLTEAVIVEAFRPKETLLPSENVIADRRLLVVPAETLMLVRPPPPPPPTPVTKSSPDAFTAFIESLL